MCICDTFDQTQMNNLRSTELLIPEFFFDW